MAARGSIGRLQQRLKAIPAAAKPEMRKALEASAVEIVAIAKRLAPVESGALRDSIGWTYGDAPRGSLALAKADVGNGLRITIYAGSDEVFYARWVEFGTAAGMKGSHAGASASDVKQNKTQGRRIYRDHPGAAAQPFFFPAYRIVRRRVKGRIGRAVNKAAKTAAGGG